MCQALLDSPQGTSTESLPVGVFFALGLQTAQSGFYLAAYLKPHGRYYLYTVLGDLVLRVVGGVPGHLPFTQPVFRKYPFDSVAPDPSSTQRFCFIGLTPEVVPPESHA